ncbi:SLAIN motif-containing protein 1a [Takifugu rubripes]|uniref:SLAIN motif family, member 1a n=1 Tax=Takifugu rubripes TaxID=31033 RepID=A0A3B5KHY8_TAKRU|nr:SLAIN motif-containing protein 1 [Takifugu rubripes]|eukprot:XP_011605992.1 PREDICTED: SLAIN motif-containing protein 1 [Takifugu rubripes]
MEAEVLSPQMMADVSGNSKITNAELEVLKLQELVRKLEKQNEQLRTRARAGNNCSVGPHLQTPLSCLHGGDASSPSDNFSARFGLSSPTQTYPGSSGARGSPEEPFAYFQPSSVSPDAAEERGGTDGPTVLDEVDVLDLNVVLPVVDPDSWLYVSPKAKLQEESILGTLQWCRQVLDHPGPEAELAKMTLCHRLDQAKRRRGISSVRPYSCIEGLSTLSCPILPYPKSAALTEPAATLPSSNQPFLQPRPSCSLTDRTPTFLSNSTLHNAGRRHAAISPQSSLDSEVGVSELEDDAISMSYKLQDMTDVEVMARLQEESLRQDYASTSATATASRRSSSFSLHSLRRSEMDLEEEDEEDEGYDQLPPPQPRLFRTGSMQRGGLPHSHTFSSIRDCKRSTTTSQFSLSGLSQYSGPTSLTTETHTPFRNSIDTLRRSMPNLIRTPSMSSVPSIPCLVSPINPSSQGPSSLPTISSLRSSQSFDSSNGLTRLQSSIPSPGQLSQRVQSVGNFPTTPRHPLKATAYVSPTVQQGPSPSSLSTSVSLHSIPSSVALAQPIKASSTLVPQPMKANMNPSAVPRSSLPRPASFVGTSGVPRASKITQPTRSLLTPPKGLAALSALRDGSWKDGCY